MKLLFQTSTNNKIILPLKTLVPPYHIPLTCEDKPTSKEKILLRSSKFKEKKTNPYSTK